MGRYTLASIQYVLFAPLVFVIVLNVRKWITSTPYTLRPSAPIGDPIATISPKQSRRLDASLRSNMRRMLWVMISGSIENKGMNFDNRIVPSAETWLAKAPSDTVFAVFADNPTTRKMVLAKKSCKQNVARTVERDHSMFRGRTLEYVCSTNGSNVNVIVTNCPDGYGHKVNQALGPLCKWDAALAHLSATGRLQKTHWIQLSDDDVYVRTDAMMRLLAKANHSKLLFVNNVGSRGNTNICPWNKKLLACNKHVPQCACWAMFSSGLAKKFVDDQRNGGIKRIAAGLGGGTDSIGPAYAWVHGAEFLPAGVYYQNHPLQRGYGNDQKIIYHGTGVRSPTEIRKLHAIVSGHNNVRVFPPWPAASVAGRVYEGKKDSCTNAMAVVSPKTAYWWLDDSKGFL